MRFQFKCLELGQELHQTPWLTSTCNVLRHIIYIHYEDISPKLTQRATLVNDGDIKNVTILSIRKFVEKIPFVACVVET